ncbi:MAG: M48 family metallopeptidase [Lachnospiraceae bacterium]|nr:M48 family metallopeptidase [Lachnospiraceae bacterium]
MNRVSSMYLGSNPLNAVRVDFGAYVEKMRRKDDAHRINGIPDYAFPLDLKLREELRKIPLFYTISKKVAVHTEARYRQIEMASAVLAGPNQFPDIYEMAQDCAKRLGIGAPNVYITHDQSVNAYTYASDTVTPTIVVHSGMVERMTPGELKCVIGHECGHVHNEHMVYQSICNVLANLLSGRNMIIQLLSATNVLMFYEWSRAAEVTCDRAAMICADNIEDAINVNKKFAYGSFMNRKEEISIDDLRSQLEELSTVASVATELYKTHPSSIRRVLASDEFSHCELLYQWRPELKKPGMVLHTKEETDALCAKYVAVLKKTRKDVE